MKESIDAVTLSHGVSPRDIRRISWTSLGEQPGQNNKDIIVQLDTGHVLGEIAGVGGSFSELGWRALEALSAEQRRKVIVELFDTENGAGLNYCRLPVGASDFALDAYSLNDNPGDTGMEKFSLDRDRKCLMAFISAAREVNPDLRLHASPWSPPGWMKDNGSMTDGGSLIDTPENLTAYALYLRKFVEGYAEAGLQIDRLNVQNEPDAASNFPACIMPPEQFTRFVTEYLAPEFRRAGTGTQIWAGTFRTVTALQSHRCMADENFRRTVAGVGFQYAFERHIIELLRLYPDTGVMHTESVCFNGENSVEQSAALFDDFANYVSAGCDVFTYWNMVLDETQTSTWGWRQNSLVVVDRNTGQVAYTPDYKVMRLISRNVRPGARRIESFCFLARVIAFENRDGGVVALLHNDGNRKTATFELNGRRSEVELPGRSIIAVKLLP